MTSGADVLTTSIQLVLPAGNLVTNGPIYGYNIPKCWKFWVEYDSVDLYQLPATMTAKFKYKKNYVPSNATKDFDN